MYDRKTQELDDIVNFIEDEKELKKYINNTIAGGVNIDFVDYFDKLLTEKNLKKANIIKAADLDRTYGYQILSGKKYASRDKILRLCIAAKFTLEETNRLLSLGSYSRLYSKDRRDVVLAFALNHKLSTLKTNMLLDEWKEAPLE